MYKDLLQNEAIKQQIELQSPDKKVSDIFFRFIVIKMM